MLNYIKNLRAIAIILIVMGHCIYPYQSQIRYNILFEIFASATIMFTFISGFLFDYKKNSFEYFNFIKKKLKTVFFPYLLISIVGIVLLFLNIPNTNILNPFKSLNNFIQILLLFLTGIYHNPPTWYIIMILGFFIISPLFLKIKNYKLVLISTFILTVLFPEKWIEMINASTVKTAIFSTYLLLLNKFVHYIFYFIFGMYIADNIEKIEIFYQKRYILFFLMFLTSILSIFYFHNGSISKIFFMLILLSYFYHFNIQNKMLDIVSRYSFYIFLIHWYFKWGYIYLYKILKLSFNPLFYQIIEFIFVFGMSIVTIFIFKKINNLISRAK